MIRESDPRPLDSELHKTFAVWCSYCGARVFVIHTELPPENPAEEGS